MLLKFCGLRRQEDVALAARLGATHCGFVFHAGSPRCVDAVAVSRLESGAMLRVGVFTGQDSGEIARIMRLARLDMAQLHAGQSVECARRLGPERVIRVLWPQRYGDAAALEAAAGQYADSCALYLLDAGRTGGGSGRTLVWEDLEDLRLPHPWLLAGGMSPANLRQALARCRPDGVDCNSGVEDAPGRKNVRAMTDMARLAGRS
ncbi:phosphoribosylanthranilate isomerase [Desulfovibrio piger]|uniref:phosphoribosylanthranilate isomerase n=1 Tax=Desulfovibrio piger TaxID=901 RepID=UPI0026E93C38|nr:phosphoribosylanthranilate isomerase [Desulfovibrio piger]